MAFQGKESLTPDFSAGREVRGVEVWSPFASAPLVLSGRPDHKPGASWGLDLSVWLETHDASMSLLKTFAEEGKHEGPGLGRYFATH